MGYLHVKDVLVRATAEQRSAPVPSWRVRPMSVALAEDEVETCSAACRRTCPSGAGLDPWWTATGVVFLEDILEELVGEVRDLMQRDQQYPRRLTIAPCGPVRWPSHTSREEHVAIASRPLGWRQEFRYRSCDIESASQGRTTCPPVRRSPFGEHARRERHAGVPDPSRVAGRRASCGALPASPRPRNDPHPRSTPMPITDGAASMAARRRGAAAARGGGRPAPAVAAGRRAVGACRGGRTPRRARRRARPRSAQRQRPRPTRVAVADLRRGERARHPRRRAGQRHRCLRRRRLVGGRPARCGRAFVTADGPTPATRCCSAAARRSRPTARSPPAPPPRRCRSCFR